MEAIRAPRGTKDIMPEESWKWAYVLKVCRDVADDFGYREVQLPIFEHTELFCRGIGDTTDVVEKEMYTFTDRGGRSITLRPELTASMVRAYLEHDLRNQTQPVKLWSAGPMFRYERPQKGRYRQFWQVDVEALGVQDPLVDLEVIGLSLELYRRLGLSNLEVVLNSVGCPKCRPEHRKALTDYLMPRLEQLCETCQGRFSRNPLRILDCKNPSCKELTEEAPAMTDHLCDECREHFDALLRGLDAVGAKVSLDKRLVRGLDYYTKTAYEILSGDLGAQNAVCGGGRYDHLAEAIGGPFVPGVGFASGIERIVITMESQGCSFGEAPNCQVFLVSADQDLEVRLAVAGVLKELRSLGVRADMDYSGKSFKAQMKLASQKDVPWVCIIGRSELEKSVAAIKDMGRGNQEEAPLSTVAEVIFRKIAGEVR
ncbi:LOW QUALITY PROTEIN: histidyl-tRNA synthetase [Thermanaerovibrio velox DSM 12556]|uniref:Histidine--tRNA ligase n=1 Tax=Thermanaerovibrio velox DSM 12556 TaxID=926567 RepID=H0UN59_9BACT|nr:LOW QUALITY PROTEIN: histidyl-tRNA synthetase [Thermanaerovibrio velox DSM 12556]